MAETDGREDAPLSKQLRDRAYEFEFFQAVRLLEWIAWEAEQQGSAPRDAVGGESRPRDEVVRFRVPATTAFPAAAVSTLREEQSDSGELTELRVSFLGLVGQSGVLPQHYTTEVIDRSNEQDHALRDFMDIFHHRAISLFYQAWRKYRLPMVIERMLRAERGRGAEHGVDVDDAFTMALRSLVGLGTNGVRQRMSAPDEAVLYYAGHYSHSPRSAVGLERVLADFFRLPAEIVPFIGRWLILPPSERTCMPSQGRLGRNFQVGNDALVGGRVWEIQTRFRVRLGPMTYQQFQEFTPPGRGMKRLSDLVRLYIGPALEFEVQPVLKKEEVPIAQLGKAGGPRSNVGWNAWLKKGKRTEDAEEAIFQPGA